jgi:hypothetical protein
MAQLRLGRESVQDAETHKTIAGRLARESVQDAETHTAIAGRLARESIQDAETHVQVAGRAGRLSIQYAYPTPATLAPTPVATITLTPVAAGFGGGRILIDWGNNGVFGDTTGEDVTTRTRRASTFRGNQTGRRILPPQAGTASVTLTNQSGDYYPDNSSSPITGQIFPGRGIRVQETYSGTLYILWTGKLDTLKAEPHLNERRVAITGLGNLSSILEVKLSTEVHFGKDTGTLINVCLDAASWPAALRSIDTGITTVPVWWEDGTTAWQAIQKLFYAEGPGALIYEDGQGRICFRNRYFKATTTRASTSQATFNDTGGTGYFDFDYDQGWRDIINTVSMDVPRRIAGQIETVWTLPGTLTIPASTTYTTEIKTSDPVYDIQPITGAEDLNKINIWVAKGAINATSFNRTSGQSFTASLTASALGEVIVERWEVRARPLKLVRSPQTDSDATSIASYGKRDDTRDYQWVQYPELAEDLIDGILLDRKDPRRKVTLTLRSDRNPTRANLQAIYTQLLSREIGDRITIVQTRASVSRTFWIEAIEHQLDEAGELYTSKFYCEETRDGLVSAADVFIFDSATNGLFNTNKFGQ